MNNKKLPLGQGHGDAGHYGGLPKNYRSSKNSKAVILPIPFDLTTTYQKGTDKGPEALIEASRNMELYDIETDSEPFLKGIYTAPAVHADTSEKMIKEAYETVQSYLSKGQFVITLGGEHSISLGPIKACSEAYPDLTVLQLDAHADLQDAYENNPWSHASIMARVKELPNVKTIISVGIRSMSSEELPNMNKKHMFFAHDLHENDLWMDRVSKLIDGPVYVTFDLDAFDSSLMPSTGTPEPGGLSWHQATKLLRKIFRSHLVIGCDVVELCPHPENLAPDYLAAKLVYKLLSYKFEGEK